MQKRSRAIPSPGAGDGNELRWDEAGVDVDAKRVNGDAEREGERERLQTSRQRCGQSG